MDVLHGCCCYGAKQACRKCAAGRHHLLASIPLANCCCCRCRLQVSRRSHPRTAVLGTADAFARCICTILPTLDINVPRADLPRPSPTADAALQVRRKLGLVALPAPSSPMLALPGVPGATPGGKALALRREGAGASSEELRGVLMPPRHKGLVPAIRGAHALHNQGALGGASLDISPGAQVFCNRLCFAIVEPEQTGVQCAAGYCSAARRGLT